MTTIACDIGSMAADSTRIIDGHNLTGQSKLSIAGKDVIGCAGCSALAPAFVRWWDQERPGGAPATHRMLGDESYHAQFLILTKLGEIYYWSWINTEPTRILDPFFAIGSGAEYALGAMEAGRDPADAVKIAAKRDGCTGGRVQLMTRGADKWIETWDGGKELK